MINKTPNKKAIKDFTRRSNPIIINGIYVIVAVEYKNQAIFWCQYCKRFHYHGLCGEAEASGYRHPHCILGGYSNLCNSYYLHVLTPNQFANRFGIKHKIKKQIKNGILY